MTSKDSNFPQSIKRSAVKKQIAPKDDSDENEVLNSSATKKKVNGNGNGVHLNGTLTNGHANKFKAARKQAYTTADLLDDNEEEVELLQEKNQIIENNAEVSKPNIVNKLELHSSRKTAPLVVTQPKKKPTLTTTEYLDSNNNSDEEKMNNAPTIQNHNKNADTEDEDEDNNKRSQKSQNLNKSSQSRGKSNERLVPTEFQVDIIGNNKLTKLI